MCGVLRSGPIGGGIPSEKEENDWRSTRSCHELVDLPTSKNASKLLDLGEGGIGKDRASEDVESVLSTEEKDSIGFG
jgi:hypothetical protein